MVVLALKPSAMRSFDDDFLYTDTEDMSTLSMFGN